eukprot:5006135-Pyramimonas_sp.AAC.1
MGKRRIAMIMTGKRRSSGIAVLKRLRILSASPDADCDGDVDDDDDDGDDVVMVVAVVGFCCN